MKYGLECEPKAIEKYERQTQSKVVASGLWVNPKFPFLACSPDGLVGKDGLIEIKSLKIFKQHSIAAVTSEEQTIVSKEQIRRQCFLIKDDKCHLKEKHDHYYQVQMQLLVTNRTFCDFILYSGEGPVSIERIYRNEQLITEILTLLTVLWTRIIAPEKFEMRVPRGLYPVILWENQVQPDDSAQPNDCVQFDDSVQPDNSAQADACATHPTLV